MRIGRRCTISNISLLGLLPILILQAACSREQKLTGKWDWVSTDCYRGYAFPGKLEFFDDGTYVGEMPFLSGGKYSTVDRNRLRLDTTAGPRIYEYAIEGDSLTLRSDANCSYRYERAK